MGNCKLCWNELSDGDGDDAICGRCKGTAGLVSLPPPRRPAAPCARCQGRRFVRVVPREYTSTPGEYGRDVVAPMTLTAEAEVSSRFIRSGNDVKPPNICRGKGVLETYVCAGCGFVEWYCQDPKSIPIGPEYMSDIVDYGAESEGPYR
jgi:hypothetical protein